MDTLGQVGLVKTAGFWSNVIKGVTQSEYSHVVIDIGNALCIGAEPGGAHIRPHAYWGDIVWSQFQMTPNQQTRSAMWAEAQKGKPYSYIDDFFIGIALEFHESTPMWIQRELSNGESWECAAMGDAALTFAGVEVFPDHRLSGAVFPASFEREIFRPRGWLQ